MNKFIKRNRIQIITLSLILGLMFTIFGLIFTRNGKILAQDLPDKSEEKFWQVPICDLEIPIGLAAKETIDSAKYLSERYETITTKSAEIVTLARELANIPDQCLPSNCNSGCSFGTEPCNPHPCVAAGPFATGDTGTCADPCHAVGAICCEPTCVNWADDENNCGGCGIVCPAGSTCGFFDLAHPELGAACWETCWDTCPTCDVNPCSGQACPDYNSIVTQIDAAYAVIDQAQKDVEAFFTGTNCLVPTPYYDYYYNPTGANNVSKLNYIKYLLEASRIETEKCVTPSEFFSGEESVVGIKEPVTCQEASFQMILPEKDEEILNDLGGCNTNWWEKMKEGCLLNNFVCCTLP